MLFISFTLSHQSSVLYLLYFVERFDVEIWQMTLPAFNPIDNQTFMYKAIEKQIQIKCMFGLRV